MFNMWDVVEELVAGAYERHTTTITMSQIRKQIKSAKKDGPHYVEEVRKTLIRLGYRVGEQAGSRSGRSSIPRKDL